MLRFDQAVIKEATTLAAEQVEETDLEQAAMIRSVLGDHSY
ncbi:MAG TPA: hypothetical protein PKA82_11600 [Pyrinomonadaceae bacterium]|nr:hypothetical protein [Pyrinomonadaceae bacterium]